MPSSSQLQSPANVIVQAFAFALLLMPVMAVCCGGTPPEALFSKGDRIVFLGDSITAAGHYVAMLEAQLRIQRADRHWQIINVALPSEGCTGLSEPDHPFPRPNIHERLQRILEKTKPHLVVACYGMNDAIYSPYSPERFEKYQHGIKRLIAEVKATGAKLVLLTPPAFDPEPLRKRGKLLPAGAPKYAWSAIYEDYAEVIDRYAQWIMTLADEVDQVIDVHTPIRTYSEQQRKKHPDFAMSADGVHLNHIGHAILARTITDAWGMDSEVVIDPALLKPVESNLALMHAAWLSDIGHKRPSVKPGLPLEQASKEAELFQRQIKAWAGALPQVRVVVGNWLPREGGLEKASPLRMPFGVDFDPQSRMLIVELEGGRVLRLAKDNGLTTLAGDGSKRYAGDGGPANKAAFHGMHNVAVSPEGAIYIADSWNHCIRKIDPSSLVTTTIAGTGKAGFDGDGGLAIKAQFDFVLCVSLSSDNKTLLVADLHNRRIRAVDLKLGIVRTIAGNGMKGVPQDGAKAVESPLVDPRAVACDSQGRVYILERAGHALRVVETDGTIRTVAGMGKRGYRDGDAPLAEFGSPKHLAIDKQDRVIIADDQNGAIRRFDPDTNKVSTILGHGRSRPAVYLSHPHGVCIEGEKLYVVDSAHHRVLALDY